METEADEAEALIIVRVDDIAEAPLCAIIIAVAKDIRPVCNIMILDTDPERLAKEAVTDEAKVLIEDPALVNVSGNVPRLVLSDERAVGTDCKARLAS